MYTQYKVFGRNYLVHLYPFGRSCKAMKSTMNKQFARRVTIHEKRTSTIMIAQISTILTTSVFITYHYCNLSSFLSWLVTITINVSVFRHIFSFTWCLSYNNNYHCDHCLQQHYFYIILLVATVNSFFA